MNISSLSDMKLRGYLIEMYKVIRGLDKIEWTKFPVLRTDIDMAGLAQGVRGYRLRLPMEAFKSRVRNKFARSVSQRHNFFTNRVVPRLYKFLGSIFSRV